MESLIVKSKENILFFYDNRLELFWQFTHWMEFSNSFRTTYVDLDVNAEEIVSKLQGLKIRKIFICNDYIDYLKDLLVLVDVDCEIESYDRKEYQCNELFFQGTEPTSEEFLLKISFGNLERKIFHSGSSGFSIETNLILNSWDVFLELDALVEAKCANVNVLLSIEDVSVLIPVAFYCYLERMRVHLYEKANDFEHLIYLLKNNIKTFFVSAGIFHQLCSTLDAFNSLERCEQLQNVIIIGSEIDNEDLQIWRRAFGDEIELTYVYHSFVLPLPVFSKKIEYGNHYSTSNILGKPFSSIRVAVLLENNKIATSGTPGRLLLRNERVVTRSTSKEIFDFNLYDFYQGKIVETKLIVYADADGDFVLLNGESVAGRVGNTLICFDEYEKYVLSQFELTDCWLRKIEISENETVSVLFYVSNKSETVLTDRMLKEHLAGVIFPDHVVRIDKSLSSKGLDETDLSRLYLENAICPEGKNEVGEGSNDIEKRVVEIWKDVLRLPEIPTHARFADLGGHSLAATRIISRLNREFDLELSISRLLNGASVKELSSYISKEYALC